MKDNAVGKAARQPKKDDVVLCPVFSIGSTMKQMSGEALLYELVRISNQWFLKYRISERDLGLGFEEIFVKFRFFCTGLSMATFGHFWVDDVLLDEELRVIWKRRRTIRLEIDKEILPNGPVLLGGKEFCWSEDITGWIAMNYPRVFIYHNIGLFLLRSNLATEYLYADVLLNLFKIAEIVTFTRTGKKPNLNVILKEHRKLKSKSEIMQDIEESEIKEFYTIRGRDAAHDWDKVSPVSRRKAIECKLWSEALVMIDMNERGKRKAIIEVIESDEGAVVKERDSR